nr:hypothetical protein [Tanacetum cinerariifolium]
MATLKYKVEHNKVGYLLKPTESDDYHQIIDFLSASHIRYALTTNPIIFDSLVKQFWSTATLRAPELGPPAILATIDKTPYTITEGPVRSRLQLANDGGNADLPIPKIYSGMDNLGYVTEGKLTFFKNKFSSQWRFLVHTLLRCLSTKFGSWDQFGSPIAIALICLSDGRRFNWSNYIFKGMVSNIGNAKKFLMNPRFLQTILGHPMPLLPAMLLQAQACGGAEGRCTYRRRFTYLSPKALSCSPAGQPSGSEEDPITLAALSSVVSTLMQKVKTLEVKLKTKKMKLVVSDSDQEDDNTQYADLDALRALANAAVAVDSDIPSGSTLQILAASPCAPTAVPPGAFDVPPSTSDVPLGASDVPPGASEVPPSAFDVPPGTSDVSPGASDVPSGTLAVPAGSPNVHAAVTSSGSPTGVSSKGKSPMVEEDIPVKARTFRQMEEDRLGEEAAKQLHDEEMAQMERKRAEAQRKRQQETLLGDDVFEHNFLARMAALIKKKRQALAEQLFKERQNRPMTSAQQKAYMRQYVKNQSSTIYNTGWTMGPVLEEPSSKRPKSLEAPTPSMPEVPISPVVTSPYSSRTKRKSLGQKHMHKPKSTLPKLDLDAPAQTFLKVVVNEDSDDEDSNNEVWSAVVSWDVLPTPLGAINALYRIDGSTNHFATLRQIHHMGERVLMFGKINICERYEVGASRPDIMFAVSACLRHQVTPTTSNLEEVKKIFKYLKGQPKLGLWYPKESPLVLEAYSGSDYAGANKDRKSITDGCQFLGRRLISWQCKKQTIVATSSTKVEYVVAANCCAQPMDKYFSSDQHGPETRVTRQYKVLAFSSKLFAIMRLNFVRHPMPLLPAMLLKAQEGGGAEHDHSSDPHKTTAGSFLTREDAPVGGDFHTSPLRSSHAPPAGQPLRGEEDPISLTALSSVVSTLVQKVLSLEAELHDHKRLFKDIVGNPCARTAVPPGASDVPSSAFDVPLGAFDVPLGAFDVPPSASDVPPVAYDAPLSASDVPPSAFDVSPGASDVPSGTLAVLATASTVHAGSPNVYATVTSSGAPTSVSSISKSPMVEEDIPIKARTFRQMKEDRLGEEAAKRLHDEEMAQIERERAEVQRKRQQEVLDSAMYYNESDWLNIRAQVEANASLSKTLLGDDVFEDNFRARMAALIKKKRQALAEQLFKERQNRPMTPVQQKAYMRQYVKNQSCAIYNTSWTMAYVKSFTDEQIKQEFEKIRKNKTNGEAMINSIKNGDQPLPRVTQVSIAGTTLTEQPPLKDKSMWSDQEKRVQKIDRLARSLQIQGLPNDIYFLINRNKTAKDLWDALARHMLDSEYGEQDRKAAVLYEYETFKATEGELLLDTYIRYLQVINELKKCGYSKDNYVNDAIGSKKKTVVVTSDPLALIAEKTNAQIRRIFLDGYGVLVVRTVPENVLNRFVDLGKLSFFASWRGNILGLQPWRMDPFFLDPYMISRPFRNSKGRDQNWILKSRVTA